MRVVILQLFSLIFDGVRLPIYGQGLKLRQLVVLLRIMGSPLRSFQGLRLPVWVSVLNGFP